MTTYSDAAKAYATAHGHAGCVHKDLGCVTMDLFDVGYIAAHLEPATPSMTEGHSPAAAAYAASRWVVDSNGYHEAALAFDAALASARQPVRVLITTESERDALPTGSVAARFHTDGSTPSVSVRGTEGWLMATEQLTPLIYHDGRDRVGNRMAPLTLLVPATAVPAEPVRLTDPDDPRIKDGARVRYQIDATIGKHDGDTAARWVKSWIGTTDAEVYLLAEAPDPDADAITVLTEASCEAWSSLRPDDQVESDPDWYRAVLATVRAKGYDVVRRAEP